MSLRVKALDNGFELIHLHSASFSCLTHCLCQVIICHQICPPYCAKKQFHICCVQTSLDSSEIARKACDS